MKIAVVGPGHMGGTLGKQWAAYGHQVMFGSRDPGSEKVRALLAEAGPNARAGTVKEAAAFGDVVLLAVYPTGVEQALAEMGDLGGKTLINCTNLFDGRSADAEVRRLAQNARVVRAFHTLTWESLANPQYGAVNASVFMSGEDAAAMEAVAGLCGDIGFDPVDVGGADRMEKVEAAVGALWGVLSPLFGRDYALRVARRESAG